MWSFLPGTGQIYNGDFSKAVLILISFEFFYILSQLPNYDLTFFAVIHSTGSDVKKFILLNVVFVAVEFMAFGFMPYTNNL